MTDLLNFDLLNSEELDPELVPYLEETSLGQCIRHPLVYSILHVPAMNGFVNKQLHHKQQALQRAEDTGAWETYVFLHERPYRVNAFRAVIERLDETWKEVPIAANNLYWQLLGAIWIDSENIRQNPRVWQKLLSSNRGCRESIMDMDEREALAKLPTTIPVFQGHTIDRDDGWSWTTKRPTAEWFARRFSMMETGQPMLTIGRVHKSDVLAFLNRRNEAEILVDRRKVKIVGSLPLENEA